LAQNFGDFGILDLGFEILPKCGQNLWPNMCLPNKSQIYFGKTHGQTGPKINLFFLKVFVFLTWGV